MGYSIQIVVSSPLSKQAIIDIPQRYLVDFRFKYTGFVYEFFSKIATNKSDILETKRKLKII